jgi:hypothetical protein
MALTEEDKKEVLDLIRKENKENQKTATKTFESFKGWLSENAGWILKKLASAAIDILLAYIKSRLIF